MNDQSQKGYSLYPPYPNFNSVAPSNNDGMNYSAHSPRNNNTNNNATKRAENSATKFKSKSWRDLWAAVLFYLHFIGVAVIVQSNYKYWIQLVKKIENNVKFAINIPEIPELSEDDVNQFHKAPFNKSQMIKENVEYLLNSLSAVGISLVIALVCLVIFLFLISRYPKSMIKGTFMSTIVLFGLISLTGFLNSSIEVAGAFLAAALINLVFYLMWRRRIPFSAILLKTVVDVINLYPNLWNLSVMAVVIQIILIFLYIIFGSFLSFKYILGESVSDDIQKFDMFAALYILFSLFWTSQVVDNVVHTSICGVFGTFYFIYGTGAAIVNPVWHSFKRSMTYSFGSIAFGSLLVAFIQIIKFIVKSIRGERDNAAAALADCLVGLIERLLCYFNYYAYVHVAIYGKPYFQSGIDTWELIKSNGVDAIINDSLIGKCMGIGLFFISMISIISSLIISVIIFKLKDPFISLTVFLTLIFSLIICSVATQLIGSGTSAIFVCYAEDPLALQRSKPELYAEIKAAYHSSSI